MDGGGVGLLQRDCGGGAWLRIVANKVGELLEMPAAEQNNRGRGVCVGERVRNECYLG